MTIKISISLLCAAGLVLCHAGCRENLQESSPGTPPAEAAQTQPPATPPQPDKPAHDEQPKPTTPPDLSMCVIVPPADLTALTGVEYATTNATANFSTIRHCEYFAEDMKYSASLLIAFDTLAEQRMEQNRRVPGVIAVDNMGNDAIWEPAQGSLTVLDENRCTVVRLSTSHGDDATRRSLAMKIAKLILDRY